MVTHRGPDQLLAGRAGVPPVFVLLGLCGTGKVQRPCHQVRRRDPVGERVVNLSDDRELVVRHAFDEVELPPRLAAIQRGAGDFSDGGVEFAMTTGRRAKV